MAEKNLKISQEALFRAKLSYNECAMKMSMLKCNLEVAMEDIRLGWQSDGGKEFFQKFDDEWAKNLEDYIAVIEHMSENMAVAEYKYREVFDEADKLVDKLSLL